MKLELQPLSTTLLTTNHFMCEICSSTRGAQLATEAKAADEQISMEAALRLPRDLMRAPTPPPPTSSPRDSVDNGSAAPTEFKADSTASRTATMGRLTGLPA
ncbi:hypothetical protein TB2_012635 [Malus domestica]